MDLLDFPPRSLCIIHDTTDITVYDTNPEKFNNGLPVYQYAHTLSGALINSPDYIVLCLPTDEKGKERDTSILDSVIADLRSRNVTGTIVIRSTVPVGYTDSVSERYSDLTFLYCPEFIREASWKQDACYPSRIIVGNKYDEMNAVDFAYLLNKSLPVSKYFITSFKEAEAAKLFSNTYLAMRVAFFNELDSFAESAEIKTQNLIECVCADPRIGDYYNSPSFGYGGYCLPKDTKQLASTLKDMNLETPLIQSISKSNEYRTSYLAFQIIKRFRLSIYDRPVVGVYRLVQNKDATNYRSSPLLSLCEKLWILIHPEIKIYEPLLTEEFINGNWFDYEVEKVESVEILKSANIILTDFPNDEALVDVQDKVYSRKFKNF